MDNLDPIVEKLFVKREHLTHEEIWMLGHLATRWRGAALSLAEDACEGATTAECRHVLNILEGEVRFEITARRYRAVLKKVRRLASH